jgi:hypothetical protein
MDEIQWEKKPLLEIFRPQKESEKKSHSINSSIISSQEINQ